MRSSIPLYDALADDYDAHFDVLHRWAYDELSWAMATELLGAPVAGRPVVDAGCGAGRWAERLVELGHEVVGIEHSPGMSAAARKRGLGDRFTLIEGSMEEVEPSGRPVGAVLAMGSLQYTHDPVATLGRFASWLEPGGLVAVLVDSLGSLVVELARSARPDEAEARRVSRRGVWSAEGQVADLHLFDRDSLAAAMSAAGLVDVEVRGLLCGWTVFGRDRLFEDLAERPAETLDREAAWSREPALVDMGKQLLGLGRAPERSASV